jgi:Arc/MetJ-type ribon-helix-helix transcriptional regulator
MTAAKIAISLPPEQLATVQAAVAAGKVASVSAYVSRAIAQQAREDSMEALVRDMVAEFGEPTAKDRAWARRVLKPSKRA